MNVDWEEHADRLAHQAVNDGEPTRWFDELYSAGERGEVSMPWDRGTPNPTLSDWVARRDAAGQRALVIGCGLGRDSEYLAAVGYAVTAIDVAPTAIRTVQERFPDSPARYRVADLLNAPEDLVGAFDLVVESYTVQALPPTVRPQATEAVARMVAPSGTLLVIAAARADDEPVTGPPWALTRADVEAFAQHGLSAVSIEHLANDADPGYYRWRAEYQTVRP
ncbi:MAG TPA: class I SAM-dependent methyltransferase [Pseudonocardiaceae bacterium]|nr:class I SAM-dependent methyltransferase [Pseudonocardiaceae bacterium]